MSRATATKSKSKATVQSYTELKRQAQELSRKNASLRDAVTELTQRERQYADLLEKTQTALKEQYGENVNLTEMNEQLQIEIRSLLSEEESRHVSEINSLVQSHEETLAAVTKERNFIEAKMLESGLDPMTGQQIGPLTPEGQREIEKMTEGSSDFFGKSSESMNNCTSKLRTLISKAQKANEMARIDTAAYA
ncbi:ninein-like [Oscarella lobularis]|uniref:ninein-like n=1 Tax=Oscarella lobularis TaxID=121494 RepID=UPI00331420C7